MRNKAKQVDVFPCIFFARFGKKIVGVLTASFFFLQAPGAFGSIGNTFFTQIDSPDASIYSTGAAACIAWKNFVQAAEDLVNPGGFSTITTWPFENFPDGVAKANWCTVTWTAPSGSAFDAWKGIFLQTCPTGQRFFEDAQQCVLVTAQQNQNDPPKNNGPSCPKGSAPEEPSCGKPINPGTGNMWHTETDVASVSPSGQLGMHRIYNSEPVSSAGSDRHLLGARWSLGYDAVLKPEAPFVPNRPLGRCFRREDSKAIFCENPVAVASVMPQAVSIFRGDGKKYLFNRSGTSWISDSDVDDHLDSSYNVAQSAITGWIYRSARRGTTERFDANGRLISITERSGMGQKLTYSDGVALDTATGRIPADAPVCSHVQGGITLPVGRLICATDSFGRQQNFEYDFYGRITRSIDPLGQVTAYGYDGPSAGCLSPGAASVSCRANNLTTVTYPDGAVRTYFYNEAAHVNGGAACPGAVALAVGFGHLLHALTGIIDENGARSATWEYDFAGRATMSMAASGVEKVALAYGPLDTTGSRTTTVTHFLGDATTPLTTVRQYQYQAVRNILKISGIDGPCVECGATKARSYDANGNVATSTDWNGVQTTYFYDFSRNLEVGRTEAIGTPVARTTATRWHPIDRLPIGIAEPKLITTMTYDASGNLLTHTLQATADANGSQGFGAAPSGAARIWRLTYNSLGQILTATGPRTDVVDTTSYRYDSMGNLATLINPAGHATNFTRYDANGRLLSMTDMKGSVRTMTYSPRGWLLSSTVKSVDTSDVESMTFTYDGVGQIKTVTFPDGRVVSYAFDDAYRLSNIADNAGNKIAYTLDKLGNRISEVVTDSSGVSARSTSRIYDALNRLQQVIGGGQ